MRVGDTSSLVDNKRDKTLRFDPAYNEPQRTQTLPIPPPRAIAIPVRKSVDAVLDYVLTAPESST